MGVVFSAILGLVGGFGVGLYLQNTGSLAGNSRLTLVFPVVGMLVMVVLNVMARRRRRKRAA